MVNLALNVPIVEIGNIHNRHIISDFRNGRHQVRILTLTEGLILWGRLFQCYCMPRQNSDRIMHYYKCECWVSQTAYYKSLHRLTLGIHKRHN